MTLVERFWAVLTTVISIVSFSPLPEVSDNQIPLQLPLSVSPIGDGLTKDPGFPIFQPPGGVDESNFTCKYPAMPDWEDCSHELDRKCWLRNKKTGKQFDINTDYEHFAPTGVTRYYNINITDSWFAADGLNFTQAKLFNNTYPGPWIQACWGDRLVINVTNVMKKNGTSVHWHGIRQLNTTHMDGVNGITQCPIAPGDHMVYDFNLWQYGSSWYHSHYSVQYADGAVGPMTIHGPSSGNYDEAVSPPLIMTDWYHNSAFSIVNLKGPTGGKDILLNGRGDITKFNNKTKNETEIKPPRSILFDAPRPGQGCKKYLIRVINTSFDTTFVFSIDNHLLTVVSADFVPIQPYTNTSILVGIGQRYNVVVEANPLNKESPLDPDGNYWVRTEIATCFQGSDQGDKGYDEVAILRYNASSKKDPKTTKWSKISLNCSDETYTSLTPILPWTVGPPSNGIIKPGSPRYGENFDVWFKTLTPKVLDFPLAFFTMEKPGKNISMRVNYSDPMFLHLDPKDKLTNHWPELWRVEPEPYTNKDWIYVVLHGIKGSGTGGAHPIHLHGHDFALLEQAEHKDFDPENMNLKLNNPPRRDVVLLPTNGYVVIAFKADNPGPWIVHCHIAFHISWGLGMQLFEDQKGAFALWPEKDPAIVETRRICKNWRNWYDNPRNWANPPKAFGGNCTEEHIEYCFLDDSGV